MSALKKSVDASKALTNFLTFTRSTSHIVYENINYIIICCFLNKKPSMNDGFSEMHLVSLRLKATLSTSNTNHTTTSYFHDFSHFRNRLDESIQLLTRAR